MRKLRLRAVKWLVQVYLTLKQQKENSRPQPPGSKGVPYWLVTPTLNWSREFDPAWVISLFGSIYFFLCGHWLLYWWDELTVITNLSSVLPILFQMQLRGKNCRNFLIFLCSCNLGPIFLSFRWYLPQGQAPNELPNCFKYFSVW